MKQRGPELNCVLGNRAKVRLDVVRAHLRALQYLPKLFGL
jgi:hypothetical protein